VAVTVIVEVPAGVPVGGGGVVAPPPQPAMMMASSSAAAMNVAGAKRR